MNFFDAHFEIKDMTDAGSFAGYGSVYGNVDQGDDIVQHGAFGESLSQWAGKGRMPALLWQHNQREPIGAYTKMSEDQNGLYVEGKLALKTQRGAEAYELMKMKALSGLSIGFMTREDSYDQKTGVRTIKKGDLFEVSLVTFPMNDEARVQAIKSLEQINDFKAAEQFLRESGLSKSAATALVSRVKALARSESDPATQDLGPLLAAIQQRNTLFQSQ